MDRTEVVGERVQRWVARAYDRSAPWLLGVAVCVLSLSTVRDWNAPVVLVLTALTGVAAWMARRRRWPLFATTAAGMLLLGLWPGLLVSAYYAGTTLRRRRELAAFVGGCLALIIPAYTFYSDLGIRMAGCRQPCLGTGAQLEGLANKGSALLFVGLGLVLGLWVHARREVLAGLRERAERLEREQAARAEQARAQERARIAREMHDVVAHRVSLMVLHAGALEVNAPDERTARAAELIRGTGREALDNLREVLGVLRAPAGGPPAPLAPQPGLDDLDSLLEQSRAAGVEVTRRDEGVPGELPALVGSTAYRTVQEALTNVHKHAPGASAEVVVGHGPEEVSVTVRNDAARGPATGPSGGFGLVGLRERVHLLGGSFCAGPTGRGGFEVVALLPARTSRTDPDPTGAEPAGADLADADRTGADPADATHGRGAAAT
ncbi:histidine kinase [Actinopolymorpha sp. NPDC004070]|uniref:sensor histidine kinase n=1 Tax=Actinopolymorpha sp. NPDC004070 TaxID=3154548 RepID=UPI0033B3BBD7